MTRSTKKEEDEEKVEQQEGEEAPPLPDETSGAATGGWQRGKLLGEGTFGVVHLATVTEPRAPRFKDFPSVMAVKSSRSDDGEAELNTERLLLRRLRGCPHVIRYLGEEQSRAADGTPRLELFLEYASGGSLAGLMAESAGWIGEDLVRRHTRSIVAALARIHAEGYVHCDVKLENVLLVEEDGEMVAKMADLGVAKRAGMAKKRPGGVRGTAVYLSPETAQYLVQDVEADVWALGCIVLEMLGGRLPWEGAPDKDLRRRIIGERPVLPPRISREAAEFLRKCFMPHPEDRATAEELLSHPFLSLNRVLSFATPAPGWSSLSYLSLGFVDGGDNGDGDQSVEEKETDDATTTTMYEEGRETTSTWDCCGNQWIVDLSNRVWSVVSSKAETCATLLCGHLLCCSCTRLSRRRQKFSS